MVLNTPLLEVHEAAGATMAEYFGTLLPANFGDYGAEYQALRETVGLVDSNFRAFFLFTGPDRQRYVNAILTSNVRDLEAGARNRGIAAESAGTHSGGSRSILARGKYPGFVRRDGPRAGVFHVR